VKSIRISPRCLPWFETRFNHWSTCWQGALKMASRFAAALPMRSSVPMSSSLHSIRRVLKPSLEFMQNR